jgi:putative membrane protein
LANVVKGANKYQLARLLATKPAKAYNMNINRHYHYSRKECMKMMGWGQEMMGFGGGFFGGFFMLLFWGLIIVGLVFLIRLLAQQTGSRGEAKGPEDSALEILKKRYARGEIDKEEYEEKREALIE